MPLLVVATPIGNLDDITLRAATVLREADIVVAEDTRHSRKLLDHLGSRASVRTFHEHSTDTETQAIAEDAVTRSVALICDAGTPGVSDPGFRLVRAAEAAGAVVSPIPGPSAVTAFISAAGLPSDRFTFLGFLPPKGNARALAVADCLRRRETSVLYESPRRILSLLSLIDELAPEREVVVGREITKQFEEFVRGTASEVSRILEERESVRGEFVVGVSPCVEAASTLDAAIPWIDAMLGEGMRTKSIARVLSEQLELSKSELYQVVLERSRG